MNNYLHLTDNELLWEYFSQGEGEWSVDLWLEHNKRFLLSDQYVEKYVKILEGKEFFIGG